MAQLYLLSKQQLLHGRTISTYRKSKEEDIKGMTALPDIAIITLLLFPLTPLNAFSIFGTAL